MDLKDLGTTPLQDEVDFDHLQEERGGYPPPPTPGAYRFELSPLTPANFEPVKKAGTPDRVRVKFDQSAPLVIVQSPANVHNGEPFQTGISNVPRKRGNRDDAPMASDWDYLNKALEVPTRPKTNEGFAKQLIADSAAKKQFSADIEWSWNCNPDRDAYFTAEDGSLQPVPDTNSPGQNIKGCGARYYQARAGKAPVAADPEANKSGTVGKTVEVEGQAPVYPLMLTCNCGATVRAFGNLSRIRK